VAVGAYHHQVDAEALRVAADEHALEDCIAARREGAGDL
jgi:hypothetical protein